MSRGEFKPNLAGKPDTDADIPIPGLASAKIDGVRAANKNGKLLSRSLKLIPNKYVQALLGIPELHGLDGELTVGPANAPNVMQATTSIVMSSSKVAAFEFHVFDNWDLPNVGKQQRVLSAGDIVLSAQKHWQSLMTAARLDGAVADVLGAACPIKLLPQKLITSLDELAKFEAECIEMGFEGVMVAKPDGMYKFGRSTAREGGLLKIKRFSDGEAIIVGFVEEMKNNNAKTTNELGRSKRSSHAAGKEGKNTLGAFVCKQLHVNNKGVLEPFGPEFNIGTGMTADFRAEVWNNQGKYKTKIVKFKHFEHGVVDAPRHPVFLGFRSPEDML